MLCIYKARSKIQYIQCIFFNFQNRIEPAIYVTPVIKRIILKLPYETLYVAFAFPNINQILIYFVIHG